MKTRTGTASLALAAVTGVLAFVLFLAGGALLWANTHYKDADGYWRGDPARYTSETRAVVRADSRLSQARYGTIRIVARSTRPVLVAIAPSRDVEAFLRGGPRPTWTAADRGRVLWQPRGGDWTAVVMNADGSPGVSAAITTSATVPALLSLAWSLLGLGLVFVLATAMLTLLGTRPAPRRVPVTA